MPCPSNPTKPTPAVMAAALLLGLSSVTASAADDRFVVAPVTVSDYKAVFATVQSADVVPARARIGGKVTGLKVNEGDAVTAGEVIANVVDEKLALQIQGLEARIRAAQASLSNAEAELKRGEELKSRGIIAQSRLDLLQTAADVARNQLQTAESERSVAIQQIAEGSVEAPGTGRVLAVPVTVGTVVLPGETVAEIASDRYILRLEIPERHARYIEIGDELLVGARGLETTGTAVGRGTIVTVYPQLQDGRVVADAEVPGLGGYFVGERALVRIVAGERRTLIVPRAFLFQRYGLDYARVEEPGGGSVDVIVQLGQPASGDEPMVEVLAGLETGDTLVRP